MAELSPADLGDRVRPPLLVLLLLALLTSITAVGVLTALLAVATGLALTDPARRARVRVPLALPMVAYAAVTLLAAATSTHPGRAFFEAKDLLYMAVFFMAVDGFRAAGHVRAVLRWVAVGVSVVAGYALLQAWACDVAAAPPAWAGHLLRLKARCTAQEPYRPHAFFSIYMTLAGSLTVVVVLFLARLAMAFRRSIALLLPTALALAALAVTLVRGAWLGLAAALATLVLLTRQVTLVAALGLLVVAALAMPSPLRTRAVSMFDPDDPTARDRLDFWAAGARMVRDAPLLGLGPGGVRRHYPEYRSPDARRPRIGHLHNNLVQVAAETGLLGLAAWLAIWIGFFVRAGRIYARLPRDAVEDRALVAGSLAAVTAFLVAGFFEYNFGDAEVITLVWVVMAFPFVVARDHWKRRSGAHSADQAQAPAP